MHLWIMSLRFRLPRRLLVALVLIILILAATFGWLGVHVLQQDRALENVRLEEHLDTAAGLLTAALLRGLSETGEPLAALG